MYGVVTYWVLLLYLGFGYKFSIFSLGINMGALWQLSCAFAIDCLLLHNVDIDISLYMYVNVGVSPPWPRGFNLTVSAPFLGLGGGWSSQGCMRATSSSDVLSNGTASRVGSPR